MTIKTFLYCKTLSVLPDIHLYCVGGGKFSKYELSFGSLIPGNKGFGHVSTKPSIFCIIQHYVYYVLPVMRLCIPPLEAISSGCPVYIPLASIPEVLGDAEFTFKSHPNTSLNSSNIIVLVSMHSC